MLIKKSYILYLIIFSFLFNNHQARELKLDQSNFRIQRLSLEEGVAHNMVFSVVQDKRGFIWIGTMLGLIKYDGSRYTIYRTSLEDENTLSNDDITEIIEDEYERLWIGTYSGGLNIYDKEKGVFTRLDVNFFDLAGEWNGIVWSLSEDDDGNIWMGTFDAGIIKINKKTLEFKIYKHDPNDPKSISINAISKIVTDKEGNVWIGSNNGILHKYNKEEDNFERLTLLDNGRRAMFGVITEIFEGSENRLWIGTERGLYVFDTEKERYLSKGEEEFTAFTGYLVNCVYEDRSGKIWIGSSNGLHVFDKNLKKLAHLKHIENDPRSLSSDVVVDVYEDMSGVVWVGTYLGGVDKVYVNQDKFRLYRKNRMLENTFSDDHVFDLAEDNDGKLWIATNGGVNILDRSTNKIEYWNTSNKKRVINSNNIRALAVDNDNNVWIGTNLGLTRYNQKTGTVKNFNNNFLNRLSLSNDQITELYVDSKGFVWVGTFSGLNKYYKRSEEFVRYLPSLMQPSADGERISALYEDKDHNLWVGTYRGLFLKGPASDRFINYQHDPHKKGTLSHTHVFAIHQDIRGTLWIGTGGGLNKFNADSGTFSYYNEKNGLPDRVIRGILEDDAGILYLSTNKGISKFNPVTEEFYNFDVGDGLQSNMFVEGAYLKCKNGEMIFGGIKGFNTFFPENLKPNTFVPPIYITSVKRFDEELVFDKDITSIREIELPYSDNFITFEFAALDYINPGKIDYAYRLNGIDNNWVYCGNATEASYTNLPPGDYVFEVKATNSDKVWSDEVTTMVLFITPPYWRTWWFNLIIIAVFVIGFYFIHKMRVENELKKAMEIEEVRTQENEKVRKKAADDFHDELGHRLTKISLYSEIMKRSLRNTEAENLEYLDRINDLAKSLSTGVRDFIWTLDPGKDTLYEMAIRLKDFGDDLFDRTGIGFRMKGLDKSFIDKKLTMDWRRQITLTFKEAMNNALKYSKCENICLEFLLVENDLHIILTDDGIGFDLVKESKGRGLRNMQNRAANIKSKIEIESEVGKGTKIIFLGTIEA